MSTTATNVKSVQSSLPLPATNRLLPPSENNAEHPPIYLKLSSGILEMLAQSSAPPEMKLSVSERAATLCINDMEFQGARYKEPGHVEVYIQAAKGDHSNSEFRSCGEVRSRILVKSDKCSKVSADADQPDLVQSTESKIVQLLSLKPHSAKNLATKTQAPLSQVKAILNRIADAQENEMYILKKEPSPNESKDTSAPGKQAAQERQDLKAGDLKSSDPKLGNGHAPNTVQSTANGKRDSKRGAKRDARRDPKPEEASGKNETSSNGSLGSLKRNLENSVESAKRIKKNDDMTDMFELARKFQNAYGEYLELYSRLSNRKTRPESQVQKLMAMHNQLAQWKKTLWSNARSKGQVK